MNATRRYFCTSALTGIAAVIANPGRLRASPALRTTQTEPDIGSIWRDR